jgi:hypothetical protein
MRVGECGIVIRIVVAGAHVYEKCPSSLMDRIINNKTNFPVGTSLPAS